MHPTRAEVPAATRGVAGVAAATLILWLLLAGEISAAAIGTGLLIAAAVALWSRLADQ